MLRKVPFTKTAAYGSLHPSNSLGKGVSLFCCKAIWKLSKEAMNQPVVSTYVEHGEVYKVKLLFVSVRQL